MPAPLTLPAPFGRYHLVKKLGEGGMGAVYLALDTWLGRNVALKITKLTADADIQRFEREARAAAAIDHPNVCPIHDIGCIDGVHYLTMPFIEGVSLDRAIQSTDLPPPARAAAWVHQLALALDALHGHGLIHRDLKPANVMLKQGTEPILMDFGLARPTADDRQRLTRTGAVVGTPAYMSPEQADGTKPIGPATDIYSLGVILYELLTGRRPFDAPDLRVLFKQIMLDPPPKPSSLRPDLDESLDGICWKALAKDPGQRHASMAEFAAALAGRDAPAPAGSPSQRRPTISWGEEPFTRPLPARGFPRATWRMTVSVTLLAVLVGALGLMLSGRDPRVTSLPSTKASEIAAAPADVLPDRFANSIGMKFVLVRAGTFLMGSPPDKDGNERNEHQHAVALTRPYYLGVYEVTQAEYERVMGHNPSWFCAAGKERDKVAGLDTRRFPVENVSYPEALKFCVKLGELPEEQAARRRYRLPTEAEWEYACRERGASMTPFHFGPSLSSEQANFNGQKPYGGAAPSRSLGRPVAVDDPLYLPNALGLYHLHGNVWEWCSDWLDHDYYKSTRDEDRIDPQGPATGKYRILRGGAAEAPGDKCRTAQRFAATPMFIGLGYRGLRVVLVAPGTP